MKVKTADLIELALDWAVAKCLEATKIQFYEYNGRGFLRVYLDGGIHAPWEPSRYWAQGGLIIERECIGIEKHRLDGLRQWAACDWHSVVVQGYTCLERSKYIYGPTPLIAAMRCFVAKARGDEVDIPTELVS